MTFWSGLAENCDTRGGHLNLGNRITEFSNLNPATVNQVIQFSITAEVLPVWCSWTPNSGRLPTWP
jgi:hypothetical protein